MTERREHLCFGICSALLVVPLLVLYVFPTQDGPVHVYNADLIRQYLLGQGDWFSNWLELNPHFDPTWPPHLVLAALLAVFPADVSEFLYQACSLILLPLAMRYAITAFSPQAGFWSWLSFPFVYSSTFHMGFYSFGYGLLASLWMLGYWRRSLDCWTPTRTVGLALICILAFYTHFFAMLVTGILMLPIALLSTAATVRTRGWGQALRSSALPQFIAFAPALLLVAEFLLSRSMAHLDPRPITVRIAHLGSLSYLVAYGNKEILGSVLVGAVLGILSYWGLRHPEQPRKAMSWAVLSGVLLVTIMFFTLEETLLVSENGMKGGAYMLRRTQPILFFGVILWIAISLADGKKWRGVAMALGLSLTLLGFAVRTPYYIELREQIAEYEFAADHVQAGETLLALNAFRHGVSRDGGVTTRYADPMHHYVNRIALNRGAFSIINYEAVMGYFPLIYRRELDPGMHLGGIQDEPPTMDLLPYETRLGRPVDVILVWGRGHRDQPLELLMRHIHETGYRQVAVSPGRGLMEVYRRP